MIAKEMADFEKAGLLTIRDGRVLLCRKKHTTSLLILPGGVKEPGETAETCLRREVREELGDVELGPLRHLGDYHSPAAIPGKTVQVELFAGDLKGVPQATSEIKELIWFGRNDDYLLLAPSLRDLIFPDLVKQGIIVSSGGKARG
jgi:8-oxo-dGTP diphosphatase